MSSSAYRLSDLHARYPDVTWPVYMDYQATTPLDPAAAAAMRPYIEGAFGNPHARSHAIGWEAEATVDVARERVAALIGARPNEIIFTSGATESNNIAVKGAAQALATSGKRHIITTTIEHKCILDACRALEHENIRVTYLPCGADGIISADAVKNAIEPDTGLISVMAVNNEIGTIQPIDAIAALCAERDILCHTDAAQAAGKIPLNVRDTPVAMMSLSAHKMYGPIGVGALYIRRKPRVRIEPLVHGGGQERNIRSGTVSPMLCAGFGAAADAASRALKNGEPARVSALMADFLQRLHKAIPGIRLNGHATRRVGGNINISIPGMKGEALIRAMRDIAVSAGSACASSEGEASYVLRELGLNDDDARASIRFSIGRFTSQDDISAAAEIVSACIRHTTATHADMQ